MTGRSRHAKHHVLYNHRSVSLYKISNMRMKKLIQWVGIYKIFKVHASFLDRFNILSGRECCCIFFQFRWYLHYVLIDSFVLLGFLKFSVKNSSRNTDVRNKRRPKNKNITDPDVIISVILFTSFSVNMS